MGEYGVGVGGLADVLENFTTSRYDLLADKEFEEEVVAKRTTTYFPQQYLDVYTDKMPVVFNLYPEVECFTKLPSIMLHGTIEVENTTTGTFPERDEVFSLVNTYPHALFSNVAVRVGNVWINDASEKPYPYKAYIENVMVHGKNYSDTIMSADGYYKDANARGEWDAEGVFIQGEGWKERRKGLCTGAKQEFCIPLHHDIITATRDLPPMIEMEVKLTRNTDSFVIWAPDNKIGEEPPPPEAEGEDDTRPKKNEYQIKLSDLRLTADKVKVTDKIFNRYANRAKGKLAEIPFTRNMIRSYTTRPGSYDWSFPNFVQHKQLPETVYVVFVPLEAYEGKQSENPFNFEEIKFNEASLIVNGRHEPTVALTNVDTKYRRRDFYQHFLNNTGQDHFNNSAVNISMEEYFDKGYFILAWDRTPSGNNRYTRHTMDEGAISLHLKLNTPKADRYQVIMYCSYSDSIKIDEKNNVQPIETF